MEEARAFLHLADTHTYFKIFTAGSSFFMDGISSTLKSKTEWYWASSGNKISYSIPWLSGQPDNGGGDERCLEFRRESPTQNYAFSDRSCGMSRYFTCQRIDFYVP